MSVSHEWSRNRTPSVAIPHNSRLATPQPPLRHELLSLAVRLLFLQTFLLWLLTAYSLISGSLRPSPDTHDWRRMPLRKHCLRCSFIINDACTSIRVPRSVTASFSFLSLFQKFSVARSPSLTVIVWTEFGQRITKENNYTLSRCKQQCMMLAIRSLLRIPDKHICNHYSTISRWLKQAS